MLQRQLRRCERKAASVGGLFLHRKPIQQYLFLAEQRRGPEPLNRTSESNEVTLET